MSQYCFILAENIIEFAYQKVRKQFEAKVGRVEKEIPPNCFFYKRGLVKGKLELSQNDGGIRVIWTIGSPSYTRWLLIILLGLLIATRFINPYYVLIGVMISIIALFPRTMGGGARREFFVKEIVPQFCASLGGTGLQQL